MDNVTGALIFKHNIMFSRPEKAQNPLAIQGSMNGPRKT